MTATFVLCIVSSMAFCFCVHALGRVAMAREVKVSWVGSRKFSMRARRLARNYLVFSFSILTLATAATTVKSFIDLFKL